MSQQFHFWVFIWKNWNQNLKEIFAFSGSPQHFSQQPRYGNKLNVHEQIKCSIYSQYSIIQPYKKENPATCNNINKPERHSTKWNKLDTEE